MQHSAKAHIANVYEFVNWSFLWTSDKEYGLLSDPIKMLYIFIYKAN